MKQISTAGAEDQITGLSQPQNRSKEEEKKDSNKQWKRNYDNLTDNDRNNMLVDEIFSLYLYRIS